MKKTMKKACIVSKQFKDRKLAKILLRYPWGVDPGHHKISYQEVILVIIVITLKAWLHYCCETLTRSLTSRGNKRKDIGKYANFHMKYIPQGR